MAFFFFCPFDSVEASLLTQQASETVNSELHIVLVQRVGRLASLSSQNQESENRTKET